MTVSSRTLVMCRNVEVMAARFVLLVCLALTNVIASVQSVSNYFRIDSGINQFIVSSGRVHLLFIAQ